MKALGQSVATAGFMVALLAYGLACPCHGEVVISEFMAKNDETLIDGDGNYSDWIELYNMGTNSVDLTGWYLSDDTNDLARWAFPAAIITAGNHMIIFASGQETTGYTDGLGYLHTTFKLSASGESVVLTRADATTVAHSFVDYPEQDDDISYGLEQESSYSYLVVEEQDATALVGTYEPASDWNTLNFNDSSWLSGPTGVGYEKGPPDSLVYTSMINLDLADYMFVDGRPPTVYDSAYIRIAFTLADVSDISQLALRMKYDDGFVAYINGTEVAAANAPASPTYDSSATADNNGLAYEDFVILNADVYLQAGDNVLAIHGLDYPVTPMPGVVHDFFIMPELTGIVVGEIRTNSAMYFSTPTPNAANVFGVLGYVGDTTFTVDRGFYTNAFDVEIGCTTDGASIYYTVDGTTPATDNGTLYTGAVTIAETTVLRAGAFLTGYQPSDIDTQTYLFLDDIAVQSADASALAPEWPSGPVNGQVFDYAMDPDVVNDPTYADQIEDALLDIPSISIVTDPDNLFDAGSGIYVNALNDGAAWERETSVELINPDGTDGFQINGGIRIRGGMSRMAANPKHSFRLFFRSEYGTARLKYELFGDEGADSFKRIDLRTGQNFSWHLGNGGDESTWLYDIFVRDAHREMGQPYTRGRFYHLYLNGQYWGLYQTEERPDARFGESYHGDDSDDYDIVKSGDNQGLMEATDGMLDAYQDLWTEVNAGVVDNADYFAIQGMNDDGTENSSYTRWLDADNVIDYMLLVFYVGNRDSPLGPPHEGSQPRNLFSLYNRTTPDGFKFVAHDAEHALGYHLTAEGGVDYSITADRSASVAASSTLGTQAYFNPWWLHLQLMNNAEYKLRFADHVHRHLFNDGVLTAGNAAALLSARKEEMAMAIIAESARWGDYVTGTPQTKNDDWLPAVDDGILAGYLQATPNTRRDVVLGQLEAQGWYPTLAAPELNQHGGSIASGFSLSISGASTVYYTTDGSDPREIGGAVSGTAYSSAIPLNRSVQVKARIKSGSTWSALTEATFVLNEASPLRVTEIMYNPAAPVSGIETNYAAAGFEFIEVLNTGTETIGLAGTEFTEGIHFEFSDGDVATLDPGEYAVLVNDLDAFKTRYTNWASIHIAGEYHGQFFIADAALANAGEQVALQDGHGATIQDFEYNDWYDATDGEGFSLTLIDPTADTNTWSDSTSWRPSKYSGGTPGEGPEAFLNPDDLVINEVLTHQDQDDPGDWVELYNPSTNAININGWYLSDNDTNLMKVALGGLSTIGPGGYLVLTEYDHFGTTAAGSNGFGLSELGEAVYLSSAEGGVLTGYRLEEDFDGADRDVTFGRYVKSDGDTDFPAQSSSTYGTSNAYPRVGPIVISEIHYHPADSNAFEFIELYNTASSNVPLHDVSIPTNVWRLDGAVEFSFPASLTMGPGSYLIISETNAAAFEGYYTIPGGTTVLGPYSGKLGNDGESLRLESPGDPEPLTGEIPEILVERVVYDDATPWPTNAAGGGYSLRRLAIDEYANDSINWSRSSSDPTPGTGDTNLVGNYTEMTVAGTFNEWNASGANMTLMDNFTWEWTATFTNQTSVEFKFAADGSWARNWGDNAPAGQELPLHGTGDWFGSNILVNGTLDGLYVFIFDDRSLAYSLGGFQADADGDGMTDEWERFYFGGTDEDNGGAYEDWDGDGLLNLYEEGAGTDPTNGASLLALTSVETSPDHVISWWSVTGKQYSVWTSTNLPAGFGLLQGALPATPPLNSHTTTPVEARCRFYRITVDEE